jgi:Domain of unknown function (DUF4304)
MARGKSETAARLDDLQSALRPFLKDKGFTVRGRTFNRITEDGLTQVVNLQMGSFDPPGTIPIPGLRENLYGRFTVNLGVYVPEVARYHGGGEARSYVQEYHCCVRARLGELGPEHADVWWEILSDGALADEMRLRLDRDALPFLARFQSRDAILREWGGAGSTASGSAGPPRIHCAIILAVRGRMEDARMLLAEQARETRNPGHPAYVRALAEKLGVGNPDVPPEAHVFTQRREP